jgi:uncharacterized membrane protein
MLLLINYSNQGLTGIWPSHPAVFYKSQFSDFTFRGTQIPNHIGNINLHLYMNKLLYPGRIIYAIGIIALGILCFILKDFIVGHAPPWPASFNVNPALGYISGAAIIMAGIAVIAKKHSVQAALLIAVLILTLSISRHLLHFIDWLNTLKSMALLGGSLIIAVACSKEDGTSLPRFLNDKILVLTGTVLLAVFFIGSGYAHFKFSGFVIDFIPGYIPFHPFWTYFCGICLFAGGAGLLIPQTRSLAALLAGIMVGGWFVLLHIPRFYANMNDPFDRMGLCESFTFCGIFFVLAAITAKKK